MANFDIKTFDELFDAVLKLKNIEDCRRFFEDVCTIKELQDRGVWIVGTDGSAETLYTEQDMTGSIAIIIGSEGKGMGTLTMKNCDFLVKIPMMGKITSLNASVSGGIVVFEALRQRLIKKK